MPEVQVSQVNQPCLVAILQMICLNSPWPWSWSSLRWNHVALALQGDCMFNHMDPYGIYTWHKHLRMLSWHDTDTGQAYLGVVAAKERPGCLRWDCGTCFLFKLLIQPVFVYPCRYIEPVFVEGVWRPLGETSNNFLSDVRNSSAQIWKEEFLQMFSFIHSNFFCSCHWKA